MILAQHVPQRLGLLRAQVDGLVIADGDLVGAFAGGKAKNKLKIPNAHAHLDAVGVGLAIIGRLGEIDLRLRSRTHGLPDYSARAEARLFVIGHATEGLGLGLEKVEWKPGSWDQRPFVYRRPTTHFGIWIYVNLCKSRVTCTPEDRGPVETYSEPVETEHTTDSAEIPVNFAVLSEILDPFTRSAIKPSIREVSSASGRASRRSLNACSCSPSRLSAIARFVRARTFFGSAV